MYTTRQPEKVLSSDDDGETLETAFDQEGDPICRSTIIDIERLKKQLTN